MQRSYNQQSYNKQSYNQPANQWSYQPARSGTATADVPLRIAGAIWLIASLLLAVQSLRDDLGVLGRGTIVTLLVNLAAAIALLIGRREAGAYVGLFAVWTAVAGIRDIVDGAAPIAIPRTALAIGAALAIAGSSAVRRSTLLTDAGARRGMAVAWTVLTLEAIVSAVAANSGYYVYYRGFGTVLVLEFVIFAIIAWLMAKPFQVAQYLHVAVVAVAGLLGLLTLSTNWTPTGYLGWIVGAYGTETSQRVTAMMCFVLTILVVAAFTWGIGPATAPVVRQQPQQPQWGRGGGWIPPAPSGYAPPAQPQMARPLVAQPPARANWGPQPMRPPDYYAAAAYLPSGATTFWVTAIFGLIGLAPAIMHSNRAERMGVPTNRYWKAFGWGLAASFMVGVAFYVVVYAAVLRATSY